MSDRLSVRETLNKPVNFQVSPAYRRNMRLTGSPWIDKSAVVKAFCGDLVQISVTTFAFRRVRPFPGVPGRPVGQSGTCITENPAPCHQDLSTQAEGWNSVLAEPGRYA